MPTYSELFHNSGGGDNRNWNNDRMMITRGKPKKLGKKLSPMTLGPT
jgi:hypothetical protein